MQLPAMSFAKREQHLFTFQGDCVGNQPPMRSKALPTGIKQAWLAGSASDKDRVGSFEISQRTGCFRPDHLDPGGAEGLRVDGNRSRAFGVPFDRNRPAVWMGSTPFDRNRPTTGAHIPQQLSRNRQQSGQGRCPYFLTRDVAVILEGIVGKARDSGQNQRVGSRNTLDCESIECGDLPVSPFTCASAEHTLSRAAHMLQNREEAVRISPCLEKRGYFRGSIRATTQNEKTSSRLNERHHKRVRSAVQRQIFDIGKWPPQPCSCQRKSGRGRNHFHFFGRKWRERVTPMPKYMGSPVATTQTACPRN